MWNIKTLAVTGIATCILVAGSAFVAFNKGRQSGMSQIQTQWDAERQARTEAQMEEMMKARQREEALKVLLARQRKEHKNEVNRVLAEYRALSDSLRDRPEARAGDGGVPQGAELGAAGCTGEGLARPDAEFLGRFAADAARLQAALNACIAHAAEVERQLNGE